MFCQICEILKKLQYFEKVTITDCSQKFRNIFTQYPTQHGVQIVRNLCSVCSKNIKVSSFTSCLWVQLDCRSSGRTRIINLPTNQKGYDTFETTVGKLSARRIQIYPDYFCLGIILKVILNNFQNNA